ncbi:MAG TPA: family 16 glycoside hydrolase [Reyranella sp.]|nr:family 16 glycoside hydrolase [Reyranella sp.]
MVRIVFVALLLAASPAAAQYVVPLATPDGKVGCTQGMTGIGRIQHWEAVKDKDAPAGWALAETSGDSTDLHFPFCLDVQTAARDFDAAMRFKILSGSHEQAAGLMFRAQNASDYFVAWASALRNAVKLYRVLGGRRTELANKDTPVKAGAWHTMRVLAAKGSIEVWLDGASMLTYKDRLPSQAGAVGVWTQSDSLVHFGQLLLAPPAP